MLSVFVRLRRAVAPIRGGGGLRRDKPVQHEKPIALALTLFITSLSSYR